MYSRKESTELKQAFWTAFGQYMHPVLSADGESINWINYKTGIKEIYFRMNADSKLATIGIEIMHKDKAIQTLYFEKFKELQHLLDDVLQEEWKWELHREDEFGKLLSKIYATLDNVNIFNKHDWPALISLFKPRIIALDEFWSTAKHLFEELY